MVNIKTDCIKDDIYLSLYLVETDATVSTVNELYIFNKKEPSYKKLIFRSDKSENINFHISENITIYFSNARFFIQERKITFEEKTFNVNYLHQQN